MFYAVDGVGIVGLESGTRSLGDIHMLAFHDREASSFKRKRSMKSAAYSDVENVESIVQFGSGIRR